MILVKLSSFSIAEYLINVNISHRIPSLIVITAVFVFIVLKGNSCFCHFCSHHLSGCYQTLFHAAWILYFLFRSIFTLLLRKPAVYILVPEQFCLQIDRSFCHRHLSVVTGCYRLLQVHLSSPLHLPSRSSFLKQQGLAFSLCSFCLGLSPHLCTSVPHEFYQLLSESSKFQASAQFTIQQKKTLDGIQSEQEEKQYYLCPGLRTEAEIACRCFVSRHSQCEDFSDAHQQNCHTLLTLGNVPSDPSAFPGHLSTENNTNALVLHILVPLHQLFRSNLTDWANQALSSTSNQDGNSARQLTNIHNVVIAELITCSEYSIFPRMYILHFLYHTSCCGRVRNLPFHIPACMEFLKQSAELLKYVKVT